MLAHRGSFVALDVLVQRPMVRSVRWVEAASARMLGWIEYYTLTKNCWLCLRAALPTCQLIAVLIYKNQVPLMSAPVDPSTSLPHDAVAIVGAGEIAKVDMNS